MSQLPLVDCIKVLFRNLIDGKNVAVNAAGSYEVAAQPPTVEWSHQTPLSRAYATPNLIVKARLLPGKAHRLWLVNSASARNMGQTYSNLG